MPQLELNVLDLEGLALIDNGIINQMFRFHALKIGRDCADRPGEAGARTLTITISAIPVSSQKGTLDHVKTEIAVSSKLPTHRTKVYQMRADDANGLLFNPAFADAVDQMQLPLDMS